MLNQSKQEYFNNELLSFIDKICKIVIRDYRAFEFNHTKLTSFLLTLKATFDNNRELFAQSKDTLLNFIINNNSIDFLKDIHLANNTRDLIEEFTKAINEIYAYFGEISAGLEGVSLSETTPLLINYPILDYLRTLDGWAAKNTKNGDNFNEIRSQLGVLILAQASLPSTGVLLDILDSTTKKQLRNGIVSSLMDLKNGIIAPDQVTTVAKNILVHNCASMILNKRENDNLNGIIVPTTSIIAEEFDNILSEVEICKILVEVIGNNNPYKEVVDNPAGLSLNSFTKEA